MKFLKTLKKKEQYKRILLNKNERKLMNYKQTIKKSYF